VQNLVTQVELTPAEVLARLPAWSPDAAPVGEMRRTASGRWSAWSTTARPSTGQEARQLFGLRSADFDAAFDGARIVFTVRGYGHRGGHEPAGPISCP
jgi:peptidoglycan hydrolase-like amidase